ncbi:MAG: AMP-binding protein, partial [Desulfocucumaceae bacterium]
MDKPWHRHYDYDVPTTIRYPRLPVHELVMIPAGSQPDKAALYFYGTEISFWELRGLILRMANALGSLGVQKGDRVGIHLPNIPQYVISYYAALSLGAVVVNLNPMYTPGELVFMARNTGITTLITFDMVAAAIRALVK